MRIGLFSVPGDRQTAALRQALEALAPGSTIDYDITLDGREELVLDDTRLLWKGADLTRLELAFVRGFGYTDPVIPQGTIDRDYSVWRFDHIAEQARYTALYSALCEMQRRGVRVVNPPDTHLRSFMKPALLEQLRAAGFHVPDLVCTNDAAVAKEFCANAPAVLWRPVTGRAAWQVVLDKQREALFAPNQQPVLLAGARPGSLVRAYIYEGRPLLLLQHAWPDIGNEERLEEVWSINRPQLAGVLSRLALDIQARWFQATLLLDGDTPWVFDVDTDPLYDWLPPLYFERLTARLSAAFLDLDASALQDLAEDLKSGEGPHQQRPTLFLRRMLQILFEFELSKYPAPPKPEAAKT